MAVKKLTILQINDVHAYLDLHPELFWEGGRAVYRAAGGYARIATLVAQARRENPGGVLFLDNGDTLHGTLPAVRTQGAALVGVLNPLGLDAMTAHWEFAYGPEVFQQRASELNYPVLAMNVKEKEGGGRPFLPFMVKDVGGLRVGVVGLASNIIDKTMPPAFSKGLRFDLGRDDLPGVVEHLRIQERVELVVLLSHLGYPQDMQLLSEVQGIDVCLSGHTHNRLREPVRQGGALLIQSGSHGSFLGQLEIEVEGGKVSAAGHRLLEVEAGVEPDPQMESLVRAALAPFEAEQNEVVGETLVPLDRGLALETQIDNLLLDALLHATGAQMAFSNGWRYGAPILPGKVRLGDLYNIIPVNPPVSTVEITGAELWDMLEENLEHTFARDPYQQMGGYVKRALGIRVLVKVENPYPTRIQRIFVGEQPVHPEQTYRAAFVTEQGVPAQYGQHRQQTDLHAVQAMQRFLGESKAYAGKLRQTYTLI